MRFSIVTALLLLSGCSGLLHTDTPADQAYFLRAAHWAEALMPPTGAPSLRIGRTLTSPGLDGDRIMLVRSDHRMDYYAGSRWVAPIPQMIEDLTAETLRQSGAWSSVYDSQGVFSTDYYLQLDIRRFEADYTAGDAPTVHVVFGCAVGKRSERELLASFIAEARVAADANRLNSVVAAFESATQTALATIAQRSSQALRK
jgi:cholesterol transport system auxiliary component